MSSLVPSMVSSVVMARGAPSRELDAVVLDPPGADLGAREVLQEGQRPARPLGDVAGRAHDLQVVGVLAVGEIQANHVHPRLDEPFAGCWGSREAGPMVATILVRRIRVREYSRAV